MIKRIPFFERPPAFYGGAWFDAPAGQLVCLPIPFNLIAGICWRIYWRCKGGVDAPSYYRELTSIQAQRKAQASFLAQIHTHPDESVKKSVRNVATNQKIPLDDIMGGEST